MNNNNAQSSKWVATCHGLDGVILKAINFSIPGIHLGQTDLGGGEYTSLIIPGDHVTHDPLDFDFLVDSDYANFQAMFEWMVNAANAADYVTQTKTITLHLLNNYSEFSSFCVDFTNAYPTDLAMIPLDNTNDTTDLQCSITLSYERMELRRCCTPLSDLT